MKNTGRTFKLNGENKELYINTYHVNGATALGYLDEEECFMPMTTNSYFAHCPEIAVFSEDKPWEKDWVKSLKEAKVIESEKIREIPSGFIKLNVYKLTDDFIKEVLNEEN